MKKYNFLFAIGLILVAGLLVYVSGTGIGKEQKKNTESQVNKATEETPLVEVQSDKQQLIGVKLTEAAFKPLSKTIRTVGRVESDERKITTVNLKVEGWIEKLYADYSGKYVKKGDPIADIYSPELLSTQLEFVNLL